MSIKCIVILLKSTSDCFNKELFFSFEQKKNFRKDSFFDALMPVADSLSREARRRNDNWQNATNRAKV